MILIRLNFFMLCDFFFVFPINWRYVLPIYVGIYKFFHLKTYTTPILIFFFFVLVYILKVCYTIFRFSIMLFLSGPENCIATSDGLLLFIVFFFCLGKFWLYIFPCLVYMFYHNVVTCLFFFFLFACNIDSYLYYAHTEKKIWRFLLF